MIFSLNDRLFESEKERNLYAKFFAGYFLNELVAGYEERVTSLCNQLSKSIKESIKLTNPHISFDNHAYLLSKNTDKGEFADVLLQDSYRKIFVSIEVKYLSNWSVENDLVKNLDRLDKIKEDHPNYKFYFFLLVSKTKWEAVMKMRNSVASNYKKYLAEYSDKVGILFWEDLVALCANQEVVRYMTERLEFVNAPRENRMFLK
ncbi:hypothetical protein [Maridesulfovibrio frigidus]|uniref:hypothetical protein n=1 Tax=Maridesulfovibrio frigidus TaxID=340956 RepID=UPI0004E0ED75|nr:hypothetical protein [Maridesulfovibrio frigidus]